MPAFMRCSLPSNTSPPSRSVAKFTRPVILRRRLLRNARLRRVACWFIHWYIRLVYLTTSWSIEGSEWPHRLRAEGKPFILAFWHGRLLMIPMAWRRLAPMHMLISAHPDGQIIRCRDLFRCRFGCGLDQPRRLRCIADNAEAAQGGRLRRNHAGRPTRPGDDREQRDRQYRPARPGADPADHLRDESAADAGDLGPLSSPLAIRPWRLSVG